MAGTGAALLNLFGSGNNSNTSNYSAPTAQEQPQIAAALASNPSLSNLSVSQVSGVSPPSSADPNASSSSNSGAPSGVNQQVYDWAIQQGMSPADAAMMAMSAGTQPGMLTKTAEGLMPVAMMLLKERLERGQPGELPRHTPAQTQQPQPFQFTGQPPPNAAAGGAAIVAELL
jgi:hypothetical protein